MSQNMILIVMVFNLVMIVSSLADKKIPWAVYWVGALVINIGTLMNLRGF
jgi:hypothetical protein